MFGCGGCDISFTGTELAHCASCHETFSGYIHFDHHRKRLLPKKQRDPGSMSVCVSPQSIGMVKGGRGKGNYWVLRPAAN